jgi:hypothetical protein
VGKRPSSVAFLLVVALAWFAAGVVSYFELHAHWKLIPTIVFAGIGLLYLRGGLTAYLRREGPAPSGGRK